MPPFTRPHLEPVASSAHIATQFIVRPVLILFSRLFLNFPNRCFPLGFGTPVIMLCLPPLWYSAKNMNREALHVVDSFSCYFLLGCSMLPSTLPSNTFNLCFSLCIRGQVSHTYKTVCIICCFSLYCWVGWIANADVLSFIGFESGMWIYLCFGVYVDDCIGCVYPVNVNVFVMYLNYVSVSGEAWWDDVHESRRSWKLPS